jgi:hypothetical protein
MVLVLAALAQGQSTPDAPSESKRVTDRQFCALTAANRMATYADAATTVVFTGSSQHCTRPVTAVALDHSKNPAANTHFTS